MLGTSGVAYTAFVRKRRQRSPRKVTSPSINQSTEPPDLGLSWTVIENGVDTFTTPSLTITSKRKVSVALTFGVVIVADDSVRPDILAVVPESCVQE